MDASDLEIENTSDEDVETLTAAEVLQKMEEAWLNEKFSPDILENRWEVVECFLEQIQHMESSLRLTKRGDYKMSLHRMEIDRIRYVISSYLRTRLKKIEQYTQQILQHEEDFPDQAKLTSQELAYAKDYQSNMDGHFKMVALRQMPPNLQMLDPKQSMVQPNLDCFVFLRVNEDVDGVLVDEETVDAREDVVDLERGDQHIMRYRPIAGLLDSSQVSLI